MISQQTIDTLEKLANAAIKGGLVSDINTAVVIAKALSEVKEHGTKNVPGELPAGEIRQ